MSNQNFVPKEKQKRSITVDFYTGEIADLDHKILSAYLNDMAERLRVDIPLIAITILEPDLPYTSL